MGKLTSVNIKIGDGKVKGFVGGEEVVSVDSSLVLKNGILDLSGVETLLKGVVTFPYWINSISYSTENGPKVVAEGKYPKKIHNRVTGVRMKKFPKLSGVWDRLLGRV